LAGKCPGAFRTCLVVYMNIFPSLFDPLKRPISTHTIYVQKTQNRFAFFGFWLYELAKSVPNIYSTVGIMYQELKTTGKDLFV
jgi:hypothetical protein